MARPKRKEKERQRTRQDIIEAAARVFARRGFNDASMQDIAREAGYSAPSLYAYFEGKDAIFSGLVCLMAREFDQLFELTFPASLTFFQRLELLVLHHTQWADRRREAFFALMSLDPDGAARGLGPLAGSERRRRRLHQPPAALVEAERPEGGSRAARPTRRRPMLCGD